ncbi:MAG TPA: hypothetical protein VFG95_02605, partial [Nitrospiria bacterium]|nr:hypothetical protein [Nitrospiria bacterium]
MQKRGDSAPAWIALSFCLVLAVGGCIHPAPAPPPPNLPEQGPERRDPYVQGVRNYREGFFESAIREFKRVPTDHPHYKQSQNYLEKAAEKIMEAGRRVNDALAMKSKGDFLEAKK